MIWILFVLLTVLGGAAAVGIAASDRKKTPASRAGPLGLPDGGGLLERTVRDLRVGDVLTIDGKDFLTEGVINYDEDGHRWICGRVVDAADVRWLMVGIERAGGASTRLLTLDSSSEVSGYPAEQMLVGTIRYTLDKRGSATCKLIGDLGTLGAPKSGQSRVERCRWWLYNAAGDDTLLIEQWGADYRVLRGTKVGESAIDLIPGS